ncbi:MAG: dihydropteroate synthase, partial [Gemmatimonadaceae bacterium]
MHGRRCSVVRRSRLRRPLIAGVVNVTPDSFSDGGNFLSHTTAVERAEEMLSAGADSVEIGGESTRPGATPVDVHEE